MTPSQAIEIADRDGFCHIGQHTFLWKTCEAAASVKVDEINAPYILVVDGNWGEFYPVRTAANKRLIKAIGERK